MPEKKPRWRSLMLTVAAAVAASLCMVVVAPQAQGYQVVKSKGRPGSVSVPAAVGIRVDTITGNALYVPARWVAESPAAKKSWQKVCVRTTLYNSSHAQAWDVDRSSRTCRWISPRASRVSVPGPRFTDLWGLNSFIYGISVDVTWQLASGKVIGSRLIDYNATKDYRCVGDCLVGMTRWGGGAYVTFPNM